VILIQNNNRDAAFYFSIEEYLTRNKQFGKPVLMVWHVDNCIMIGKNQVVEAEVNLSLAKTVKIPIIRRQSGGGAIYVDEGTVLCTLVSPLLKDAENHMEEVSDILINALSKMGVSAYREGKNDILLDGKKIVGMAQFTSKSHICTHASLLYDTDLDALTKILIPHDEKLVPKGIRSIRSRVTNIKQSMNTNLTAENFKAELQKEILSGINYENYEFTPDETSQIELIYQDYKEKYKHYAE